MSYRDQPLHYWGDEGEDQLGVLREAYPRWRVWRGQAPDNQPTGWYATRAESLTDEQVSQGLYRTLDADTGEELRALLDEQEQRSARLAVSPSGGRR